MGIFIYISNPSVIPFSLLKTHIRFNTAIHSVTHLISERTTLTNSSSGRSSSPIVNT